MFTRAYIKLTLQYPNILHIFFFVKYKFVISTINKIASAVSNKANCDFSKSNQKQQFHFTVQIVKQYHVTVGKGFHRRMNACGA